MATILIPPPNALMMTGADERKIAIHGKHKVGVFPDWWVQTKTVSGTLTARWGEYSSSGPFTTKAGWTVPFQDEPEISIGGVRWLRNAVLPSVYEVTRASGESASAFLAKVALCEELYGVEFIVSDGNDHAMAEIKTDDTICKIVAPGYFTVLYVFDDYDDRTVLAALRERYGGGRYAIAISLKFNGEQRLYRSERDGDVYDRFFDVLSTYGYTDDFVIQYKGYALYRMDPNMESVSGPIAIDLPNAITARILCNYNVIGRAPSFYTTVQRSSARRIYSRGSSYMEQGWSSALGNFSGIGGSPSQIEEG